MTRPAPRIAKVLPQHRRRADPRRAASHLVFIRSIGICLGCGSQGPCEAAHVRSSGDGFAVPLGSLQNCGCHHRQHQIGERRFYAELQIDPVDVSLRLWIVSGDIEAGRRIVFRARQNIELKRRISCLS